MKFTSLRSRLFIWYTGSLIILSAFFFIVVHILSIPGGVDYFFILFILLTLLGYYIIYRLTQSITDFSSRIRRTSSKNLTEKILDIESQDEIGELAVSYNNLLDRLNDAFVREQQFIADVAHEMKTPIATLRGSFEVALTKERTKEEYKKQLASAIDETDQLSSTLNKVLDLAWSENSSDKNNMTPISVSELMDELGDIAQKLAIKKHISIKTNILKNLKILCFKEKLAQAILNIIENAIKYTPINGTVTIVLKRDHQKALLSISDTGAGIAKEDIPHIFDRFYRGAKTENVLGNGLGLAISKSIIILHQGYITVDSQTSEGTTFTIALPLL